MRLLLAAPGQVQLNEIQFEGTPPIRPVASFDPVPTADAYQYWVSYANVERTGFGTVPQEFENGMPVEMTLHLSESKFGVRVQRGFQYWLWVRASNEDGFGPWSDGQKFIIPEGTRPTERPNINLGVGADLASPNVGYTAIQGDIGAFVRWDSDPLAQVYDVIVQKDGVQIGPIRNTGTRLGGNTTFNRFLEPADIGVYEFWVRARNGHGTGPWSYRAVVGVGERPVITGPTDSGLPARPEISWTRGAGEQNYELWVSSESTQTRVIHETTLTTQSYTPSTDLPDGIYIVWVREVTHNGYKLPWSVSARFEVGTSTRLAAPVLSHVDHLTGGTERDFKALFNWNAVPGADHYELYVANPRNGSPYDNPMNLTDTTYTTIALEPGFHYRTWVRTISGAGVASDWSDPLRISVTSDGRVRVVGT